MPGQLSFHYTLPKELSSLAERFPKAANAVLNRTGMEARTKLGVNASDHFNVPAARIKERITVVQSTWNTLRFLIKIKGKKFPLINFVVNGKQNTAKKGVSPQNQRPVIVEIVRGKRTTLAESPFQSAAGGKAFIAKGSVRRRTGNFAVSNHREDITLWRYIHPIIFFKNPAVWNKTVEFIEERLLKELPRVVKVFIETGKES